MNLQIENRISEIADRARARYDEALHRARTNTKRAAGRVSKGKKPVKAVSRFGVKLSGVSHRTVNKLWKRQTKLVEDQIDAVASHLKAAADANGLKNLLESQVELLPDNANRFKDEVRESFGIVKGAGSEIRAIVKDTLKELRGQKTAVKKTAVKKTAVKKAPTARKPVPAEPAVVNDNIAA